MTTENTDLPTNPSVNPLNQFIRHAEVYVTLPSRGRFYESHEIELTPNGELAISPMTTNDDLMLKSPEGLLNGDSIARVIQSCAPGIKNVYSLLVPDLDVILLAMRQASYGDEMDFDITCPECKHEGRYGLSITEILSRVEYLEDEYSVQLSNELTVFLKPFNYSDSIKETMQKYQESQVMKVLLEEDLTEDPVKAAQFSTSLQNLANLMTELCSNSITKILDPNDNQLDVTSKQIHEWMTHIPSKDANIIQEKLSNINSTGVPKEKPVKCEECAHTWQTEINFDPSVFFGISS